MVKSNWITEITHFEDQKFFVDEQRFGPYACGITNTIRSYRRWKSENDDIVNFKLPLGVFGDLLAGFYVKNKVKFIFESRFKILEEIFKS
jgi:hypothetical protein